MNEDRFYPFAAGVVVALVLALLTTAVVAIASSPADGLEPGPLVVLSGHDDSIGSQRQRLLDQWNLLHRDNPASIVELSTIADAQRSEMVARAQTPDARVDVYNLDVTWTAEFAQAGYVQSLGRTSTDGFLAGPLSTCRYDGQLWALPFNADVGLLYYRTDLLARLPKALQGPPRDWDTLVTQVAKVRDLNPDIAGYLGQTGDYEGLTVTALEMLWGAGGTVVDDYGRVLPDNGDAAALRTGLDRLRNLGPDPLPALNEAQSQREFRLGHALFLRNWPIAYRTLTAASLDGPAPAFDVAPLPGSAAALGGQNLAVASRTTRPRAARALIEFLTGDRSEQVLFERGGLPATRAVVYTDPRIHDTYRFTDALRYALDHAQRRPVVPHYAEFSQAFRADAGAYLRDGRLDVATVRADLDAALLGRLPS